MPGADTLDFEILPLFPRPLRVVTAPPSRAARPFRGEFDTWEIFEIRTRDSKLKPNNITRTDMAECMRALSLCVTYLGNLIAAAAPFGPDTYLLCVRTHTARLMFRLLNPFSVIFSRFSLVILSPICVGASVSPSSSII